MNNVRHWVALAQAIGLVSLTVAPVCGAQAGPSFVLVADTELMVERASTGGITWVDFDGDGDDDAFVTNGYDVSNSPAVPQPNRLYENVDGHFVGLRNELAEDAGFSSGSAWADLDNDGLVDLFVPNQRRQDNFLYRNMGGGSFLRLSESRASTDGGLSFAATWGDIDSDGYVDLFVANGGLSGAGRDFLYRNLAGRAFQRRVTSEGVALRAGRGVLEPHLDEHFVLMLREKTIRV